MLQTRRHGPTPPYKCSTFTRRRLVGCVRLSKKASVAKPKPIEEADKQKLTESFFTNLSPGTNFGFKMASAAIIACP